jgi:hypothetical protein
MTPSPAPEDSEESPFAPRHTPDYAGSGHSYTLASLLLIVTGIGVFLGIGVRWPAAAVCLSFLCVPAFFRTVAVNVGRKRRGCPLLFHEKVRTFGVSLLLTVVVALVSGATAALVIWLAVMMGEQLRHFDRVAATVVIGGSILGVVTGGVVGVALIRGIWLPGIASAAARQGSDRKPQDRAEGAGPSKEPPPA